MTQAQCDALRILHEAEIAGETVWTGQRTTRRAGFVPRVNWRAAKSLRETGLAFWSPREGAPVVILSATGRGVALALGARQEGSP